MGLRCKLLGHKYDLKATIKYKASMWSHTGFRRVIKYRQIPIELHACEHCNKRVALYGKDDHRSILGSAHTRIMEWWESSGEILQHHGVKKIVYHDKEYFPEQTLATLIEQIKGLPDITSAIADDPNVEKKIDQFAVYLRMKM